MKKKKTQLSELILLGVTARTNNKNEMNPKRSKIAEIADKYWGNQLASQFKDRINPGVTFSVYTEYESDENGEYTYFIGEQVKSLDDQDHSKFKVLILPAGTYQKFTTEAGKIPGIVIAAWQNIWQMNEGDFEGKRKYLADFEIYAHKSK